MFSDEEENWQVVSDGGAHVREGRSAASKSLGRRRKCELVAGKKDGDWLALSHGDGYMQISSGGNVTLRRMPAFKKIQQGRCADVGMHPIADKATCTAAAAALGLDEPELGLVDEMAAPEGCYLKHGESLWLDVDGGNRGRGAMAGREPLCSSSPDPVKKCLPTTATATTTYPFPSLFCFCVTGSNGPELELVRMQINKKWGIFLCDEYTVLSHGGKAWLAGDWFSSPIPAPEEQMGNTAAGAATSSWLNTVTFQKAWQLIKEDGRFLAHDWTLKVDPDAVIFPSRVRAMVKPHAPPGMPGVNGTMKFFLNCNRLSPNGPVGPGKLYGSVEVYSRKTLMNYFWATPPGMNAADCERSLPWHTWGEDLYMEKCMEMLGAQPIQQFGWVADKRCIPGDCSDPTKVAHHDFKDKWAWTDCWNQGSQAEQRR